MKKNIVKKGLVLAVVFLFVAVSFQPVLANEPSEKVTVDDEKIEYTIQIVKTNKVVENKVYLSQEQVDNLDRLFNNFKIKLENTITVEDTIEVYYQMIDSLYKIGLIPKCINVEEAKQLITGKKPKLNTNNFLNFINNLKINLNMFCNIYGETDTTYFFTKIGRPIFIFNIPPVTIASTICYGGIFIPPYSSTYNSRLQTKTDPPYRWNPAVGYVNTNGLFGKKIWNGEFYGQFFSDTYTYFLTYTAAGVKGFRGFHFFNFKNDTWYYFGRAMIVKLGGGHAPDPPWP